MEALAELLEKQCGKVVLICKTRKAAMLLYPDLGAYFQTVVITGMKSWSAQHVKLRAIILTSKCT